MPTAGLPAIVCCGRFAVLRQALPRARTLLDPSTTHGQVSVRWASVDRGRRPLRWDSFGIWDNRIEEPVLLPSSVKYGKPIPQVSLSRVGSASVVGRRRRNEDRLQVGRLHDNLLYFAVFDGHGGSHASDYCHSYMETHIRDALEEDDDLEKVLTHAFLNMDQALHTYLSRYGNAWNSLGVSNVDGKLAVTRSIGDFHLKHHGVIATPETARLAVHHADDNFLALTTDGINFLLSDQEICDVINQSQNPTEAAEVISQQAQQYGSEDNSSIIIVPLGAWARQQRPLGHYSLSRNLLSCGRWA